MYAESDLIPLSALQHYMVCPRQCALIHLEQIWEENVLTAEGRILHERVDAGGSELRGDVRRVFGLPIRSLRLGLSGKADVVEFHRQTNAKWLPYPVEYKRGRRKSEDWDRVQLCAQAICLEEMLAVTVPAGAMFYGKEQRREVVTLQESLRRKTAEVAVAVHRMLDEGRTPSPRYTAKCDSCSLRSVCLPRDLEPCHEDRVSRYLVRTLDEP